MPSVFSVPLVPSVLPCFRFLRCIRSFRTFGFGAFIKFPQSFSFNLADDLRKYDKGSRKNKIKNNNAKHIIDMLVDFEVSVIIDIKNQN